MKLYGVVGFKDAGKTGLVARLVAEIAGRGLRVSTIKHTHHNVDLDRPGTDTFRHREAGAEEVMLASGARWALLREGRGAEEPPLDALLARLAPVDLVIAEGFKTAPHPKMEVWRRAMQHPLLAGQDGSVRAVAADCPAADLPGGAPDVPVFDLNDTRRVADFVLGEVGL